MESRVRDSEMRAMSDLTDRDIVRVNEVIELLESKEYGLHLVFCGSRVNDMMYGQ